MPIIFSLRCPHSLKLCRLAIKKNAPLNITSGAIFYYELSSFINFTSLTIILTIGGRGERRLLVLFFIIFRLHIIY